MRKKYSPQAEELQGSPLRGDEAALHIAASPHPQPTEAATFEDLLALRYELELRIAQKRGLRHLPSPEYLARQRRLTQPAADPRFHELSLAEVRAAQHRRELLRHLSVR